MKHYLSVFIAALLFSLPVKAEEIILPPGAYQLDKSHASLIFGVSHIGFSNYTMSFDTMTGESTANIHGDLELLGIKKSVVLKAKFNGGYAGHPMDPHARIGFSAHTSFNRSDFGMTYGIPELGTSMGVGDEINVTIEAEFSGPPLKEIQE
ncbi:MAG: YceI family protein [Micavibrio sp.]